jgi:hypothetical protein
VPASVLHELVSTPLSVQNAAGLGAQTSSPFTAVTGRPPLIATVNGPAGGQRVPEVVYVGADYCPYCAIERYALVLALSRIGTFHGLTTTVSGANDGSIPAFSFHGASYASAFAAFRGYEAEDRNGAPLDTPPPAVKSLWTAQSQALSGSIGFPFLNFGGKFALSGEPAGLQRTASTLIGSNGRGAGLSMSQLVEGIHHPGSTFGSIFGASAILSEANYIDGAVCVLDGGKPATVCGAAGVRAAEAVLRSASPRRI